MEEELQCCLTVVMDLQQYLILIIDEDAESTSIIISWSHFSFLLRRVVVPRAIKDEGKEKSLLRRRSLNKYLHSERLRNPYICHRWINVEEEYIDIAITGMLPTERSRAA